jgi:hypothetical protein
MSPAEVARRLGRRRPIVRKWKERFVISPSANKVGGSALWSKATSATISVLGNEKRLRSFRDPIKRLWLRALRRRGQRDKMNWGGWVASKPAGSRPCNGSTLGPRNDSTPDPRQVPDAIVPPVRVCAGGDPTKMGEVVPAAIYVGDPGVAMSSAAASVASRAFANAEITELVGRGVPPAARSSQYAPDAAAMRHEILPSGCASWPARETAT